jgi:hypothetical protein
MVELQSLINLVAEPSWLICKAFFFKVKQPKLKIKNKYQTEIKSSDYTNQKPLFNEQIYISTPPAIQSSSTHLHLYMHLNSSTHIFHLPSQSISLSLSTPLSLSKNNYLQNN